MKKSWKILANLNHDFFFFDYFTVCILHEHWAPTTHCNYFIIVVIMLRKVYHTVFHRGLPTLDKVQTAIIDLSWNDEGLRHFKNCITYLESNKSWGRKKEEKKQYHQEVVTSYYITDNKNECHVCSTIIANKGKQNQKCTIILLVWSFYGYFLTTFYVISM